MGKWGVSKPRLPDEELQICERLGVARSWIAKTTQGEAATQIGLERSTLANYESGRTPLRFDVALRFCRQFIVSEEWLATGKHEGCHLAALKRGIPLGEGTDEIDEKMFRRQCLDLAFEPAYRQIPPGTLLSVAFRKYLAQEYVRLMGEFFHLPRIVVTDYDNHELSLNLLNAINERFIFLWKTRLRGADKSQVPPGGYTRGVCWTPRTSFSER